MAYAFGGIHPFTWLGAHVTWASAPTRRVTFASTKVTQNRLPTIAPCGFPLFSRLRCDVGKNSLALKHLPTTITATLLTVGATEREG